MSSVGIAELSSSLGSTGARPVPARRTEAGPGKKICRKCDLELAVSLFCRDGKNPDGRSARCKMCRSRELKGYFNRVRFGGLRETILSRDGYRCRACGLTRDEHLEAFRADLTIDHIDGRGRYAETPNNDPENLRTLCVTCHAVADNFRHKWQRIMTKRRTKGSADSGEE